MLLTCIKEHILEWNPMTVINVGKRFVQHNHPQTNKSTDWREILWLSQYLCYWNECWKEKNFNQLKIVVYRITLLMSVRVCVGTWICVLVPKNVKALGLLVARIIGRCHKSDLGPGNELFLTTQSWLQTYKFFKCYCVIQSHKDIKEI